MTNSCFYGSSLLLATYSSEKNKTQVYLTNWKENAISAEYLGLEEYGFVREPLNLHCVHESELFGVT